MLPSKSSLASIALAASLLLLSPRPARAAGSLSYKYEDYQETGGRIAVKTQNALVEQDLGTAGHLRIQGVIDAIAGATPNGQPAPAGSDQVVLTELHERRKAWNADFSRQFTAIKLDLGLANSRESDYTSTGWSVNTLTDFNLKNTTLLAGLAGTNDRVKVFYQPDWARKRSRDVIVGVTQVLDPRTSFTFNLSEGESSGFLSDQYKLVQLSLEVEPGVFLPLTLGENRPGHRTRWIALAALNHAFPKVAGAIDAAYRFYHDSFGTDAHALELQWLQHLGPTLILQPSLRLYDQSAADFYRYRFDSPGSFPVDGNPGSIGPFPVHPNPAGPFYSSDYRLSALRTTLFGLKAVWTPSVRWQFDASVEQYDMRGRDGVTPRSAYPRAAIWNLGAKFSW